MQNEPTTPPQADAGSNGGRKKFSIKTTLTAPLLMCAILILSFSSRYISDEILGYGETLYMSLIILQIFTAALPCIFYARLRGQGYSATLGIRPMALNRIGFLFLAAVTLIVGSITVKLTLSYMGVEPSEYLGYGALVLIDDAVTFTDVMYMISTFAVLPAIIEEFVYRGVIMTEYGGGIIAAIIATLFYGISFLDIERLPIYLFCGAVYALVRYVTRSLLASVALHMIYGVFNLISETYILKIIAQPEYRTLIAFVTITVFLVFLSITFGESERIFFNEAVNEAVAEDDRQLHDGNTKKSRGGVSYILECVLSPTFIICIVLYVAAVVTVGGL